MSCGEIEWHLKNDPFFQEKNEILINLDKLKEGIKKDPELNRLLKYWEIIEIQGEGNE